MSCQVDREDSADYLEEKPLQIDEEVDQRVKNSSAMETQNIDETNNNFKIKEEAEETQLEEKVENNNNNLVNIKKEEETDSEELEVKECISSILSDLIDHIEIVEVITDKAEDLQVKQEQPSDSTTEVEKNFVLTPKENEEEYVDVESVSTPSPSAASTKQRDDATELMSKISLMPVNGLTKTLDLNRGPPAPHAPSPVMLTPQPLVVPVLPQQTVRDAPLAMQQFLHPVRLLPTSGLPLVPTGPALRPGTTVNVALPRPPTSANGSVPQLYTYNLMSPMTPWLPHGVLPRPPAFTDLFSRNPIVAANAAAAASGKPVNVVPPQQQQQRPHVTMAPPLAVPVSLAPQTLGIQVPVIQQHTTEMQPTTSKSRAKSSTAKQCAPPTAPATLQALKRKLQNSESSRSSSPSSAPATPSASTKLQRLDLDIRQTPASAGQSPTCDGVLMPPPPAPSATDDQSNHTDGDHVNESKPTHPPPASNRGRKKANWKWMDKQSNNIDSDLESFKGIAPEIFHWNGQKPMIHLFVIKLLRNEHCADLIEWMDETDLMFKVKKPGLVARLWQHIKGNRTNNYECFARGIRHSRDIGGYFVAHGIHKKKVYKLTPKAIDDFHTSCPDVGSNSSKHQHINGSNDTGESSDSSSEQNSPTLTTSGKRRDDVDKEVIVKPISGLEMLLEAANYVSD